MGVANEHEDASVLRPPGLVRARSAAAEAMLLEFVDRGLPELPASTPVAAQKVSLHEVRPAHEPAWRPAKVFEALDGSRARSAYEGDCCRDNCEGPADGGVRVDGRRERASSAVYETTCDADEQDQRGGAPALARHQRRRERPVRELVAREQDRERRRASGCCRRERAGCRPPPPRDGEEDEPADERTRGTSARRCEIRDREQRRNRRHGEPAYGRAPGSDGCAEQQRDAERGEDAETVP